MDSIVTLENQITLVNSIVKSTNNLLPLIDKNKNLNDTINTTIAKIFDFLAQVIKLLPDLLVASADYDYRKEYLIDRFENVKSKWRNFGVNKKEFYDAWEEFISRWEHFEDELDKIKKSSNTIFLSMN